MKGDGIKTRIRKLKCGPVRLALLMIAEGHSLEEALELAEKYQTTSEK